jgi:hypothetical protein
LRDSPLTPAVWLPTFALLLVPTDVWTKQRVQSNQGHIQGLVAGALGGGVRHGTRAQNLGIEPGMARPSGTVAGVLIWFPVSWCVIDSVYAMIDHHTEHEHRAWRERGSSD